MPSFIKPPARPLVKISIQSFARLLAQSSVQCAVALLTSSPLMALAQAAVPVAAPPPPPPKWNGDISLGYVDSSGNSRASSLNLKADLEYKSNPWDNMASASAYKADSDGVNTDEKYSLGDKLSYNLDPKQYVFGQANVDYDHYGPITQRYASSVGYGRHFISTPTQTFDLDLGVGGDRQREQGAASFQSEAIATLDGLYVWKFSPNSQFKQTLRTSFGAHNTFIDPISELKLTVIKNFFASIDYEFRYNSETAAGTLHTDRIATINVGYNFGKPPAAPAP